MIPINRHNGVLTHVYDFMWIYKCVATFAALCVQGKDYGIDGTLMGVYLTHGKEPNSGSFSLSQSKKDETIQINMEQI